MPRPFAARTPFPVPSIPIVRSLFLLVFALLAAVPLDAQRVGDVPRRPRLDAAADTNDARAYYRLGQQRLDRRPDEAAAAFYWASQIDPGWADPLYGRHVALLMSEPRRLLRYWEGDRRTRTSAEVIAIDSLYFRALRTDPFVQRPFERELVRAVLMSLLGGDAPGADAALASFYTASMMQDMPPLLRARVLAGEGKAVQALQAFDEGMRDNRRRSETQRYIRHERGRLFGLIGNDSAALAELQMAIDLGVEEEREELVRFYNSKAVLEHSRGMVFERGGDLDAAREAYSRALIEDLSYHPAHLRLGTLALVESDTATAVQELALAVEAGPDDPVARVVYATLLARLRRVEEAQVQLQAAVAAAPYWAEPWYMLGLMRDWGAPGDATEAYRAFMQRARRDDPRRAQVEPLIAATGG
jgi:tetratricopeptide (TPR) repeat protein